VLYFIFAIFDVSCRRFWPIFVVCNQPTKPVTY